MADVKISALPSIDATGLTINTVVASVDSGSTTTSKVTYGDFLQNTSLIADKSTGDKHNIFISAGSPFNSPTVGAEFRGTTYNSTIAAGNGVINNSRDSMIVASQEAAGGNFVKIENAGSSFMAAAFRAQISGGEQSAIIASQDSDINAYNAVALGTTGSVDINNGPVIVAGSQGGTINGNRVCHIGSEAGTINSNTAGMINSYACTIDGNLYNTAIATYIGTIDNLGGAMENSVHIGTRDSDIDHMRAQMIGTSGRTSQYSATTHTENLYSYGRIQTSTVSGGSVSNVQTLVGGSGMVQYCAVGAGNLNLAINGVRNGEVYHWVINNDTGSSVSVNSTSTDTGFTITDNTSNSVSTGLHIFTIVVVEDNIVLEGTH